MVLWLTKSSISYYALPYHNLPCSSIRESLYDVCVIMGTHFDTGVNKGYPSRYDVRNTIHTGMGLKI